MEIKEYKIVRTFRSPESGVDKGAPLRYKTFQAGSIVEGYFNDVQIDGVKMPKHIVVGERWVIPISHISEDLSGDQVRNRERLTKDDLPKSIRDRIASIEGGNPVSLIASKNKAAMRGAALGTLAGIGYAWYSKRSMIVSIIIGGIAGVIIGRMLSGITFNAIKKDKD